jgi:transaldolase
MSDRLKQLADAGVSIWLDDLSRERLKTGNLAQLVADSSVVGVTTNPTIFASALSKGEQYDEQMRELAAVDSSVGVWPWTPTAPPPRPPTCSRSSTGPTC